MKWVVVDASLWVARLVPQDVFYEPVKTWMDEQRAEGVQFVSPGLLLAEVAGAVSRRTGNVQLAQQAIQKLSNLPDLRLVEIKRSLAVQAAHLAARLGLRGADAFYVVVADGLKLPLMTLDDDQRARAANCVTVLPAFQITR